MMTKAGRKSLRLLLIFIGLIPLAAFAHFIVFTKETRCILIAFSDFERKGDLYLMPGANKSHTDSLQSMIGKAAERVSLFWGGKKIDPTFIVCDREEDFRSLSVSPDAPAVTYLKLGAHIVLNRQGEDLDIIAHEISHAEFYARIGFYKWNFVIPDWFKHGLAMQNDYRSHYSTDTLKARTEDLKNMPDIKQLKTSAQFYSGTNDQIMLHYMTAKYIVGQWYTRQKLNQFILDMNAGKSFDDAFNGK
jgi:hypothetical protein